MKYLLQVMMLSAGLLGSTLASAVISKDDQHAAVKTAASVYDAMLGEDSAQEADWTAPKQLKDIKDPVIPGNTLHVLEFSVMEPTNGAYQRIRILINADGGVAGAEILYAGR